MLLNPAFEVGMVFGTKNEFKKAVKSHAILTRKSLRFVRSDKMRVKVICCGEGCDWGIYLVKRTNESTFKIRSYESAHKCHEDVSDDEEHEGMHNEVTYNPAFEVGMVFETKDEFKKAVQSHAIQTRRSLCIVKNDKTRVYARCSGHNCDWGINLVKRVNESTLKIIRYESTHKCEPTSSVSNLNSKWLSERFGSALRNGPKRKGEDWREYIMGELNVNVSKQQASRAKRKALAIIKGSRDKPYSKLRRRKCTQVAGGEENVQVEEPEDPVHVITRSRELKVCGNKSASTSGGTHADATNPEDDLVADGATMIGKKRRPPIQSKSTLGLVDEDEDNKFEALLNLASTKTNATGLGMPTVSCTRSRTPYQPLRHKPEKKAHRRG